MTDRYLLKHHPDLALGLEHRSLREIVKQAQGTKTMTAKHTPAPITRDYIGEVFTDALAGEVPNLATVHRAIYQSKSEAAERAELRTDRDGWHQQAMIYMEERDRLRAINADLRAALENIIDFCDDPSGSLSEESLGLGLARLLPKARAAIARANQDSLAINSPALAEQPEAQANAASWPGKKAKAKEQGT